FSHYRVRDESQRVHVQGTVTYYQPGEAVVLQRGTKSLWISTKTSIALHINDEAEATGFADIRSGFLTLTNGEVRDMNVPASILPQPASWSELAASRRVFDLVSIEGQVVTEVRES